MARKKGDERKMPCFTFVNTSSHSPSSSSRLVGSGGLCAISSSSFSVTIAICHKRARGQLWREGTLWLGIALAGTRTHTLRVGIAARWVIALAAIQRRRELQDLQLELRVDGGGDHGWRLHCSS
mmetsp:Transcript_15123/g.38806  ORF Transcript_15123/g.38806 Transcript_15123/m.38806 type:complete len:124 (-) Transcript_15123:17-388(-)